MGLAPFDVDLGEQGEAHRVVLRAELLDLLVAAGLLAQEVVGREAEHHQPPPAVLPVQRLQTLVLVGVAAARGYVHDQQDLLLLQAYLAAVDILDLKSYIEAASVVAPAQRVIGQGRTALGTAVRGTSDIRYFTPRGAGEPRACGPGAFDRGGALE
jgi:hypothetical protein